MQNERIFQAKLIKDIKDLFPDCVVLKTDSSYIQGFPDILILFEYPAWAALEVKKYKDAKEQPNQRYWIGVLNEMSYANFVYPENREEVLNELQQAFRTLR